MKDETKTVSVLVRLHGNRVDDLETVREWLFERLGGAGQMPYSTAVVAAISFMADKIREKKSGKATTSD